MAQPRRSARIAIIGAGITGLAAAHRLLEIASEASTAFDVTLFEASARTGGVIRSTEHDGFLLEGGPDCFISEKPEALSLAKRIGISEHLIETNSSQRRSFLVRAGKLQPVPEGFHLLAPSRIWPFVTTPIFSWRGKARMALDLIIPRRHATDNEKEESLAQFVRRRLGNEALERMAQPMVGGIYTADPEMLSLSATMPRFLAMEREHGSIIRGMFAKAKTVSQTETTGTSGARYSLFLSFDRGMQLMTDTLADLIGPSTIKLNTRIRSITRRPPSTTWLLSTEHGETIDADAVIIALPAHASAALLRDSAPRLASELDAIPYASTATINIAFHRRDVPHPLDGFGFVVPMVEKKRIIACSFSSVKFAGRAPGDDVLLRVFAGGALQPEIFALHDKELIAAALSDLRDLLGVSAAPIFSHVERWPRSMAQYHVGHLARIKKIDELVNRTQGLRLAGNAYQGAGIPDCIRSGERAAETVYEEITAMSKLHAH